MGAVVVAPGIALVVPATCELLLEILGAPCALAALLVAAVTTVVVVRATLPQTLAADARAPHLEQCPGGPVLPAPLAPAAAAAAFLAGAAPVVLRCLGLPPISLGWHYWSCYCRY